MLRRDVSKQFLWLAHASGRVDVLEAVNENPMASPTAVKVDSTSEDSSSRS